MNLGISLKETASWMFFLDLSISDFLAYGTSKGHRESFSSGKELELGSEPICYKFD